MITKLDHQIGYIKNDAIFLNGSYKRYKFYTKVYFETEWKNAKVKVVTSQKRFVTSFKLNMNQKCLNYKKWIRQRSKSENFESGFGKHSN